MFHIDLISIDWLLQKLMRWRNGHYSCPISFICRFLRSKQDFHWSIVSSKWKWFTRIWWNSQGLVDFLVDGHCCPISLHCPLKIGQVEKSIRPLSMTIPFFLDHLESSDFHRWSKKLAQIPNWQDSLFKLFNDQSADGFGGPAGIHSVWWSRVTPSRDRLGTILICWPVVVSRKFSPFSWSRIAGFRRFPMDT